jgi:hypothetical protein
VLAIDMSVAAAWWFADEVTPTTEAILERVVAEGAVVPALFPAEVANVLVRPVNPLGAPESDPRRLPAGPVRGLRPWPLT